MNCQFKYSDYFIKQAKKLAKRHKSFLSDLEELKKELQENPMLGDDLGNGIRKVRMAITSKGKGKSSGARVITYNVIVSTEDLMIALLVVYDKSEYSNIKDNVIHKIVKDMNL